MGTAILSTCLGIIAMRDFDFEVVRTIWQWLLCTIKSGAALCALW